MAGRNDDDILTDPAEDNDYDEEQDNDPDDFGDPDDPGDQTVDLDNFLQLNAGQADPSACQCQNLVLPQTDKIVIVGIFLDDSGSMEGLEQAVRDGLHLAIAGFSGARGSDFYLDIRGFKAVYFQGMLKDVEESAFDGYYGSYRSTPLVAYSIGHLQELKALARRYRDLGIPTTVAQLIMTDGQPEWDSESPDSFRQQIESGDYIVGMGIVKDRNENEICQYRELFREMGITKTVTPRSQPAEVRHAINQFSQSVASLSSAAA